MSVRKKYLKELECLSAGDPLAKKSPQELCCIALDSLSPNRLSAIKRLGWFHGDAVTHILVALTGAHNPPEVREQALEALAGREGELVTQTFENFIRDEDVEVRRSVVRIARSASEQVRTVISLYAIADEDTGVRELADEVFFGLPLPAWKDPTRL